MDQKQKMIDWRRLLITVMLVAVSSAITSSVTWFILDRTFNDTQATNANLIESLEKKITYLDNRLTGSTSTTDTTEATAENGTILGKITYPSSGIPNKIKVFVEDTSSGKTYEATVTFSDPSADVSATATYTISVPAGSYYVYGTLAGFNDQNGSQWKAYYNQFVVCGLAANCKDTTKIVVNVEANKTVENITIGDWYPTK